MWFQILRARLETSRKERRVESCFEPFSLPQHLGVPILALFRGGSQKSEVTFVSQFSILLHKCGLRFFGSPLEDHGTPQNACYSTLSKTPFVLNAFFSKCMKRSGNDRWHVIIYDRGASLIRNTPLLGPYIVGPK